MSDRTGINNLFVLGLDRGDARQVSDLLTGISGITEGSPPLTVSRDGRRASSPPSRRAGWDLFAVKEPFALPPVRPQPPAEPVARFGHGADTSINGPPGGSGVAADCAASREDWAGWR